MDKSIEKTVIKLVFSNKINNIESSLLTISRQLELKPSYLKPVLSSLVTEDTLKLNSNEIYSLSPFGRKLVTVVMTSGVFDLLHIGHIFTFQQAKLLGDILVVVLATDKNVQKLKSRTPTNSQDERTKVVQHIKEVDCALVGTEEDFISTIDFIQPDIITLGYDQVFEEKSLHKQLSERGFGHIKIIRMKQYIPGKSTSKIVQTIINYNFKNS